MSSLPFQAVSWATTPKATMWSSGKLLALRHSKRLLRQIIRNVSLLTSVIWPFSRCSRTPPGEPLPPRTAALQPDLARYASQDTRLGPPAPIAQMARRPGRRRRVATRCSACVALPASKAHPSKHRPHRGSARGPRLGDARLHGTLLSAVLLNTSVQWPARSNWSNWLDAPRCERRPATSTLVSMTALISPPAPRS